MAGVHPHAGTELHAGQRVLIQVASEQNPSARIAEEGDRERGRGGRDQRRHRVLLDPHGHVLGITQHRDGSTATIVPVSTVSPGVKTTPPGGSAEMPGGTIEFVDGTARPPGTGTVGTSLPAGICVAVLGNGAGGAAFGSSVVAIGIASTAAAIEPGFAVETTAGASGSRSTAKSVVGDWAAASPAMVRRASARRDVRVSWTILRWSKARVAQVPRGIPNAWLAGVYRPLATLVADGAARSLMKWVKGGLTTCSPGTTPKSGLANKRHNRYKRINQCYRGCVIASR